MLSQSQKSAADSPYLLFVGSFSRVKNLENVLTALHLLHRDFPKLTLRIVGAKARSFNDLSTKIDEQLRPKIVFEGQINDTVAMIKLYQNAAALVFPSFYEASPLPPIEAMSCGCPVVASDIPSLRERCGNTAEYCRPESPESIATAIAAILSDAQFAEHLRQNGLARAAEFSWERCARETLAVFRNVLSTD
ncbi:MAG: glycosyltransferase family 1 protein [Calditrichia bacterium]